MCVMDNEEYIAEKYRSKLPKASIGKSCVRFKKLADIDEEILEELIQTSNTLPALGAVSWYLLLTLSIFLTTINEEMKILDPQNAGVRLKTFILWGSFLWLVQFLAGMLVGGMQFGILIVVLAVIAASFFAGMMTAKALKGKTGDHHSSAMYGAVPPMFAVGVNLILAFFMQQPISIASLPLIPMAAGALGGFVSQKDRKK